MEPQGIVFSEPVAGVGCFPCPVMGSTTAVYALGSREDYLLIDAGDAKQAGDFVRAFDSAGYLPGRGRAVIVTHGHPDHYGGAARLSAWAGCPVWAHPAAAVEIEDRWGGFAGPASLWRRDQPQAWDGMSGSGGAQVRVERMLREGDRVELPGGGDLEVLHAPGHQRGELVLFDRARRLAFVGDLVQGGFDASGNWLGLIPDPESQRRSLSRVAALGAAWLFKGHRRPRSGDEVGQDIAAAQSRVDRIEKSILDALGGGARLGTVEAARAAFRGVLGMEVEEPAPYALVTVEGFLAMLGRRGLVRRDRDMLWNAAG
jgi:glyoxylase-like metal-dependent hydrolase (beta-lactamase superfamily II)